MAKAQTYSDLTNQLLRDVVVNEMRRKNISQRHMAAQLGVAQQTLSTFLAGMAGAGQLLGMKIASIAGVSVDDFVRRADLMELEGIDAPPRTTDDAPTPPEAVTLEGAIFDAMDRKRYTPTMFDAARHAAGTCASFVDPRTDHAKLARAMMEAARWLEARQMAPSPAAIFSRAMSYELCPADAKATDEVDDIVPF